VSSLNDNNNNYLDLEFNSLAVGGDDHLFVTGLVRGTGDLILQNGAADSTLDDRITLPRVVNGETETEIFVGAIKLGDTSQSSSITAAFTWAARYGGSVTAGATGRSVYLPNVGMDLSYDNTTDKLYLAGTFSGNLTTSTGLHVSSSGQKDVFVAQIDGGVQNSTAIVPATPTNTPTSAPTGTPTALVNIAYVGCFRDNSLRDLKHRAGGGYGYTPYSCMTACSGYVPPYKYAGLQDGLSRRRTWTGHYELADRGAQCFCDNSYGNDGTNYPSAPDAACYWPQFGVGAGWRCLT